jgi:hypothetical protein
LPISFFTSLFPGNKGFGADQFIPTDLNCG